MDASNASAWAAYDLLILGAVAALGALLLALACRLHGRLLAHARRWWLLVTGLIGTPVHEISHAVVAKLFGIRVSRIRFFLPFREPDKLGDVALRWNPDSPWQRIGMFFVALAPFVIGSVLVILITYFGSGGELPRLVPSDAGDIGAWGRQATVWLGSLGSIATSWPAGWWTPAALFAAFSISVHALPSGVDLKSSGKGVVVVFLLGGVLVWVLSAAPDGVAAGVVAWLGSGLAWWVAGIVQMVLLAVAGLVLAGVLRVVLMPFQGIRSSV